MFHTSVENINTQKVTKKHHEKIFMTSCLPEPIYFSNKKFKAYKLQLYSADYIEDSIEQNSDNLITVPSKRQWNMACIGVSAPFPTPP